MAPDPMNMLAKLLEENGISNAQEVIEIETTLINTEFLNETSSKKAISILLEKLLHTWR